MDNTIIEVEINGTTYYVQADKYPYLVYLNGKLVNTSNDTITLVSSFSTTQTYPRITCSGMSQCRYYNNNQQNYTAVTSDISLVSKYSIYQLGSVGLHSAVLFVLLLILGVKLLWKR